MTDYNFKILIGVLLASFMFMLSGCDNGEPQSQGPQYTSTPKETSTIVYRFAIHPLHNPKKLVQAYQPLINYLNRNIEHIHFVLESSRDYQVYEGKFRARQPEFILPNPWQTLEAIKVGYKVVAMAGDAADFKGIFIVRKDSNIRNIADLKGKVVSYPSPTALAASIMPQYHLYKHGIDVNKDIENKYVGSQESTIMNTYLKQSDVGVTWPPPWRLFQQDYPDEASELFQIWETEPLLNNSVMVRDDIPADNYEHVQKLLINLGHAPEGKDILMSMSTSRFHLASNESYTPVKKFIQQFEKEVRAVEVK